MAKIKDKYIAARISADDKEALKPKLEAKGISLSTLICMLLKKWLKDEIKL